MLISFSGKLNIFAVQPYKQKNKEVFLYCGLVITEGAISRYFDFYVFGYRCLRPNKKLYRIFCLLLPPFEIRVGVPKVSILYFWFVCIYVRKGKLFWEVKLPIVISTIFEFSRQNKTPNFLKMASIPNENDGFLTFSNGQNFNLSQIW